MEKADDKTIVVTRCNAFPAMEKRKGYRAAMSVADQKRLTRASTAICEVLVKHNVTQMEITHFIMDEMMMAYAVMEAQKKNEKLVQLEKLERKLAKMKAQNMELPSSSDDDDSDTSSSSDESLAAAVDKKLSIKAKKAASAAAAAVIKGKK